MGTAAKKLNKRILNMGFAFVLALSTVTTSASAFLGQTASATTAPLSVETLCVDEKVQLKVTARQAELPGIPTDAFDWEPDTLSALLGGNIKYISDYGVTRNTLDENDIDTHTFNTGLIDVPTGSVSAQVTGKYKTEETGSFFGIPFTYDKTHYYNETLEASYAYTNCDETPPVITIIDDNPVTVEKGGVYTDQGATWTDNIDGGPHVVTDIDNPVDTGTVGTYAVTYTAIDSKGNPATATRTVYVQDTTSPDVPTASLFDNESDSVADGGYINTEHFTFNLSSTSDDITRYQLKYWNDINGSAFNGEVHAWNPTNISNTGHMATLGTYTDHFTQGQGVHYFAFSACDAEDNCSVYSAPFTVTYDSTDPTAPTGLIVFKGHNSDNSNLISSNGYTNNRHIRIDWDASLSADVDYYWLGTQFNQYHKKITGGVTRYDANMTPGHNPYYYTVIAVDHAGNESAVATGYNINLDLDTPAVSDIVLNGQPVDQGDVRSSNCSPVSKFHLINGEIDLSASLSDATSSVSSAKYKVRKVTDGGCTVTNVFSSGNVTMSNTTDDTWEDISGFNTNNVPEDGKYTIYIQVMDSAGNIATKYVDILVDNTAPDISVVSADENSAQGVTEPGLTVEVFVDGVSFGTTVADVSGDWELAFGSELAPGSYEVTATTKDTAGNDGTSSVFDLVVLDSSSNDGNPDNNDGGDNVTPVTFQTTTPDNEGDEEEVLGAQDQNGDNGADNTGNGEEVLGDSDKKDEAWTILGLTWYWWLLILLALGVIGRWAYGRFGSQNQ